MSKQQNFERVGQGWWMLLSMKVFQAIKIQIVPQKKTYSRWPPICRSKLKTFSIPAFETSAPLLFFPKDLFPKFQLQQYFSVPWREIAFFHGPQYAGLEFLRFLEMYSRYRYKVLTVVWHYNLKDYEHKFTKWNAQSMSRSLKCRFVAPKM